MKTTTFLTTILLTSAALAGCGGGAQEPPHVELSSRPRGEAPLPGFPTKLVTGPGTGPALFLGPEEDARAIGYVSEGVPVLVKSAPVGDRVRVLIDGPIKTRGWIRLARLGAYVTRGGRVHGAPASVHPCDFVGVRSLDDDGQALHVVVTPELGVPNAPTLGPYEGVLPVTAVSGERPDPASCTPPAGEAARLPAGQPVDVFDRANGRSIAQLPASAEGLVVSVARREGDWAGVRIGVGPYLIGYVHVPLTPVDASAVPPAATTTPTAAAGALPQRVQAEPSRPLLRVHRGARVLFDGETIGILGADAYAREMQRYPTGEVDVYVAANDDLALRGMVHATDVEPAEAPPEPPPAAPPPAAPEPAAPPAVAPPPEPAAPPPEPVAPRPPPRPLGIY